MCISGDPIGADLMSRSARPMCVFHFFMFFRPALEKWETIFSMAGPPLQPHEAQLFEQWFKDIAGRIICITSHTY
jgi:hypothetical protein